MSERRTPPPQWQPIEKLPLIARHIDGMLQTTTEQYELLLAARPKPHVLDDYTLNRVRQVFTTQQDELWLFDEQLTRWQALKLTAMPQKEVARLVGQMTQVRQVTSEILALAEELKDRTIEKLLAKSDLELGLETLWQKSKPPKNDLPQND